MRICNWLQVALQKYKDLQGLQQVFAERVNEAAAPLRMHLPVKDLSAQRVIQRNQLAVGRQRWGWRGKRAVRVLYTGAALLLLSYAGSRFVMEVLLGRAA